MLTSLHISGHIEMFVNSITHIRTYRNGMLTALHISEHIEMVC